MTEKEKELEKRFYDFEKFMEPFGVDYVTLGIDDEDKDYWKPVVYIHKTCENMNKIPEYWENNKITIRVFNGEIPMMC